MLNSLASAGRRVLPNQWDLIALAAIMAVLTAVAQSYHGISAPLPAPNEPVISLDYWNLPYYALRTALRMFAALAASLVFHTFTLSGPWRPRAARAEMVLVPLDVLPVRVPSSASCPSPSRSTQPLRQRLRRRAGRSCHLHQPSLEHGLFPVPVVAHGAAGSRRSGARLSPHRLAEVLAARGAFRDAGPHLEHDDVDVGRLVFVVASEAITVGDTTITLPGVGSYIAKANDEGNWWAIGAAVLTMAIVILIYDQLLFRPIVAWAAKFKVELSESQDVGSSWVLNLLQRTYWIRLAAASGLRGVARRQPAAHPPPAHPGGETLG